MAHYDAAPTNLDVPHVVSMGAPRAHTSLRSNATTILRTTKNQVSSINNNYQIHHE